MKKLGILAGVAGLALTAVLAASSTGSADDGKLEQLKAKRNELTARAKVAEAQNKVHDAVRSIDVLDPTSELGRFEDKIRREEARVRGQEELNASSLDAQFESLEDLGELTEVEARLAALKAGSPTKAVTSGE